MLRQITEEAQFLLSLESSDSIAAKALEDVGITSNEGCATPTANPARLGC